MCDGFDTINHKSISAIQLPNASEEESLNDMLTVISSPDEGKPWQGITRFPSPVEGQPDPHQLTDVHTAISSTTEGQPREDIIHSSGPIEGQPNHHLLALDSGHYNSGQTLKVSNDSPLVNLNFHCQLVKYNNTCLSICFRGSVMPSFFHLWNSMKANQISN